MERIINPELVTDPNLDIPEISEEPEYLTSYLSSGYKYITEERFDELYERVRENLIKLNDEKINNSVVEIVDNIDRGSMDAAKKQYKSLFYDIKKMEEDKLLKVGYEDTYNQILDDVLELFKKEYPAAFVSIKVGDKQYAKYYFDYGIMRKYKINMSDGQFIKYILGGGIIAGLGVIKIGVASFFIYEIIKHAKDKMDKEKKKNIIKNLGDYSVFI